MWRKAMDYLGLGPDDAYDDYDPPSEPVPRQRGGRDHDPVVRAPRYAEPDERERGPRHSSGGYGSGGNGGGGYSSGGDVVVRRPAPAPDDSSVQPRPINAPRNSPARPGQVGPIGPVGEPHTVRPRRFDSAQEVADKFKEGLPVIMNLEATDREVSRRLIDFASGLCYGLNGTMEKVATGVYLLKPFGSRPQGNGYDD